MINKKINVVHSPDLIIAIQRRTKTLSFYPLVAAMAPRLFQPTPEAVNNLITNMDGDDGDWGFLQDFHRANRQLAPGSALKSLTITMLESLLPFFEIIDEHQQSPLDLYGWVKRSFTLASMEALYGPENPFRKHQELVETFWWVCEAHCKSL